MSFTSVTIISPEAANGRNVVALGVTKALAAAGKTGVFRPAVCRKDTFTDVLIEASNAGLSREQSVGVCPKRARNDKEGSRADIVAAYTQAVETARPDAMVIVGTDRSAVNDPAMFSFNADFANLPYRYERAWGTRRRTVPGSNRHWKLRSARP